MIISVCFFIYHYLLYKPELYWSKRQIKKKIPKQQTNHNDH